VCLLCIIFPCLTFSMRSMQSIDSLFTISLLQESIEVLFFETFSPIIWFPRQVEAQSSLSDDRYFHPATLGLQHPALSRKRRMKAIKPLQHGVFVDSGTESAFCLGWLARLDDVSTIGIKRARTEVRERPNEYVLRVYCAVPGT
jgi:hypothetical protein